MKYDKEYKKQMKKTMGLVGGAVGLDIAGQAGAGLPGLSGTIYRHGVMPMGAMGLLKGAAEGIHLKNKRRK